MRMPNAAALKKAGIRESFFHAGDAKIHFAAGPPNGDPLVLIPGQGVTWEEYVLLLPLLAKDHQVYAVSLPGHGQSSWTPAKYTFNELGATMTAFIREVVGGSAIVGGNSSGGVLTVWLAANEPELVRGLILEDPPIFRCEWPAIKTLTVYDVFLGASKMAAAGGGGFSRWFTDTLAPMSAQFGSELGVPAPPSMLVSLIGRWMALHEALRPGTPLDVPFLPAALRVGLRGYSQFDGRFSQAFVDGTVGEGFDHAAALTKVLQPTLFLHAKWFRAPDGRLVGALDDDDVAQVRSLIGGAFDYVRLDCGHATALEVPEREAQEIRAFEARHRLRAGGK